MKSPPKVSKSETTRVRRPKKYKAWCIDKAVRVYKSCELIATEAREKIGPEWTYSWQNVKQLLDISFEVALGQMKETQDAFELAGLVAMLLEVDTSKRVQLNRGCLKDNSYRKAGRGGCHWTAV